MHTWYSKDEIKTGEIIRKETSASTRKSVTQLQNHTIAVHMDFNPFLAETYSTLGASRRLIVRTNNYSRSGNTNRCIFFTQKVPCRFVCTSVLAKRQSWHAMPEEVGVWQSTARRLNCQGKETPGTCESTDVCLGNEVQTNTEAVQTVTETA